jgi:hypothetical protein
MTHIDKALRQLDAWAESIQRERDHHAYVMATSPKNSVGWAFSYGRQPILDGELTRVRALMASLEAHRNRPELILERRPRHRMLQGVTLRKVRTA